MVISIRKHIDEYEGSLSRALLAAYRAALTSTVRSCGAAIPVLSAGLRETLTGLQQRLSSTPTPADVEAIQSDFDTRLGKWEEEAAKFTQENVDNVKEIIMAVAASASEAAARDDRYNERFNKVAASLHAIAAINDLRTMRQSVMASASEIKTCIEEMKQEGERSVAELQSQIAEYRAKLLQSEQRHTVDSLTGLANRASIELRIQNRIAWPADFCLALIDLNGFKPINDSWGHAAGDDLLKQFADELNSLFRASDLVGRWGGDEFAVVIDAKLDEAKALVERLRQWVFGEYTINAGGKPTVEVSAAVGLAAWDGKESASDLFNRADKLMYVDKRASRATERTGTRRSQRAVAPAASRQMLNAG